MNRTTTYDTIVVGAGAAGLTAAAYLVRAGVQVLLCERAEKPGGLLNSFNYKGFVFDSGIRAIENAGIVQPMLRQLGIPIDFVANEVRIGIENEAVRLGSEKGLQDYAAMLERIFPENKADIAAIMAEIRRVMAVMDILYGIDNPLFRDLKNDRDYLVHTVLPWLVRYQMNIGKAMKLTTPIQQYLRRFTTNTALIDLISQHFFTDTPAFFALSYFTLYRDYLYPRGGTGVIAQALAQYVRDHGGEIRLATAVLTVDPQQRAIVTDTGETIHYRRLIWAADLKRLYAGLAVDALANARTREAVLAQKRLVEQGRGGDSIFSLYLTVNREPAAFAETCGPHNFYTPYRQGLTKVDRRDLLDPAFPGGERFINDRGALFAWIRQYLELTTFEISCPALRDPQLAPPGQTGLIISSLMDYRLVRHIAELGWYDDFKRFCEEAIIDILGASLFSKPAGWFRTAAGDRFSSTPLSLERIAGNSEGAITGWAFTHRPLPVESRFKKISHSIDSPIPDVYLAGQWAFSPSGLPVSFLTGKLAADAVVKQLAHERRHTRQRPTREAL